MATKTSPDRDQEKDYRPETIQRQDEGNFDEIVGQIPHEERQEMEDRATKGTADDTRDAYGGEYSPNAQTKAEEDALLDKSATARDIYGKFYKGKGKGGGKTKGRFRISRRVAAGFGGGGIFTTVAIYIFSVLTGPLQFLSVANAILPNFSALDIMSETRTGSLTTYINYSRANPERGRLGIIGNRVADSIEGRLRADGVQIIKNQVGVMDSLIVDGELINLSDLSNRQKRLAFREVLRSKGYSRTLTSFMSRPLFTRFGIDFRFLGNFDNRLRLEYDQFKRQRLEDLRNYIKGDSIEVDVYARQIDELEGEIEDAFNQGDTELANELEGFKAELEAELEGLDEAVSSARETYNRTPGDQDVKLDAASRDFLSKIGGVGLITTAVAIGVCFTQGISEQALNSEFFDKFIPSIRLGMEAVSIADQIKAGEAVDSTELSVLAERLSNEEDGTWAAAKNIKQLQGEEGGEPAPYNVQVGQVEEDTLVQVGNALGGFFGIAEFCDIMANSIVQGVLVLAELGVCVLTASLGCFVSFAGGEALEFGFQEFMLGPFGKQFLLELLGESISEYTAGTIYGNVVAQGTHFAANEASRDLGAFSLSEEQTAKLNDYTENFNREQYAKRSFFDRFFNPKNELSLIGSGILQASESFSVASINPFSVLSATFSSIDSATTGFTVAQTGPVNSYQQIPKIAYSVAEIESDTVLDPWENQEYLLNKYGSDEALEAEFDKCFDPLFEPGQPIEPGYYISENQCDSGGDHAGEVNLEDLFRYRVYLFDEKTLLGLGCFSGDELSCSDLGLDAAVSIGTTIPGQGIVGNPYSDSTDVLCAEGTQDLGIHTGYVQGEPVDFRLCALPNMPATGKESTPGDPYYISGANGYAIVNSRMSAAWFNLINDAAASGVTLTAGSSFRTMQHQQDLCDGNAACRNGDYSAVAPPGRSSHQAGVAIDIKEIFQDPAVDVEPGASCSSRSAYTNNPAWVWMANNASDYGLLQYAGEGWHWDALDVASRCDSTERPNGF